MTAPATGPARDLRVALLCAASGLVVGGLWRVLAPLALDRSSAGESAAAVDLTLLLLQTGVGVVASTVFLLRPGAAPARRLLVVLTGLLVGGGLAWGTGLVLGIVRLDAVAAAFVAAPVTAVVVFVSTLLDYLRRAPESVPEPASALPSIVPSNPPSGPTTDSASGPADGSGPRIGEPDQVDR